MSRPKSFYVVEGVDEQKIREVAANHYRVGGSYSIIHRHAHGEFCDARCYVWPAEAA